MTFFFFTFSSTPNSVFSEWATFWADEDLVTEATRSSRMQGRKPRTFSTYRTYTSSSYDFYATIAFCVQRLHFSLLPTMAPKGNGEKPREPDSQTALTHSGLSSVLKQTVVAISARQHGNTRKALTQARGPVRPEWQIKPLPLFYFKYLWSTKGEMKLISNTLG